MLQAASLALTGHEGVIYCYELIHPPKLVETYHHYNEINEWKTKPGLGRCKANFEVINTHPGGHIAHM